MMPWWSMASVADALAAGLEQREAEFAREQAVYGLDHLDELGLHPVLSRALRDAGFGVFDECRYPAARSSRRKSEGDRCDLVLTPDGRDLHEPEAAATLFDPEDAVELSEALWLEVKLVRQFTDSGANPRYSSILLRPPRTDIVKLASDGSICHAGLILVLFTADAAIGIHDLRVWEGRCVEQRLPIGVPSIRQIPISDRFGNSVCTVALYPIEGRDVSRDA